MFSRRILITLAVVISPLCVAQQSEFERALSVQLTRAVVEINASAPQVLDEETRLDSASTFSNYFVYNNTMIKYDAAQLDVSLFNNVIKETVIDKLCDNAQLSSFAKLGVVMVYRYHGKDGEFITELSKDMGTCEKS